MNRRVNPREGLGQLVLVSIPSVSQACHSLSSAPATLAGIDAGWQVIGLVAVNCHDDVSVVDASIGRPSL